MPAQKNHLARFPTLQCRPIASWTQMNQIWPLSKNNPFQHSTKQSSFNLAMKLARCILQAIIHIPVWAYRVNWWQGLALLNTSQFPEKQLDWNRWGSFTINDNDMLSYSLTTMMWFLTKEWYGFPAYTVNLFIKAYHRITYKEDLKIT